MIPLDTIRNGRRVTLGLHGLAAGILWEGTSGGDELTVASGAVGVVAALGFVWAAISYVRAYARGHRLATIRGYFGEVQVVFTNCMLGVVCVFCAMLLAPGPLRSGHAAEVPVWYLPVMLAIAVHQFFRAARRITAKWRSIDDVLEGMRGAANATRRFSAKYDIGFFIATSIVTSVVSRFVGSGQVLLLGGVLCALSFPYVLGSMIYQRVVLARLMPNDMPLPDWYTDSRADVPQ